MEIVPNTIPAEIASISDDTDIHSNLLFPINYS